MVRNHGTGSVSETKPKRMDKLAERDTIGHRIRAARTQAGLTQDQLASRVGLVRTSAVQWESNRSQPSITTIEQVAKELGTKPAFLAFGDSVDPVVRMPEPEELGFALVPEVRFGAAPDKREKITQWGLPTDWLRNDLHARHYDQLLIYAVESAGGSKHEYGDRLIVDTSDVRPSPAGYFLCWDGVGPMIAYVTVIPGQGKKPQVKVTADGQAPYEVDVDKLPVIGRIRGTWKKS